MGYLLDCVEKVSDGGLEDRHFRLTPPFYKKAFFECFAIEWEEMKNRTFEEIDFKWTEKPFIDEHGNEKILKRIDLADLYCLALIDARDFSLLILGMNFLNELDV